MKNKKRNLIITVFFVIIIILIAGIFFFLNYSSSSSSLSVLEKKWITDNTNSIVDVDIYNNMPVYSYNGEGIVFDYLNYFSKNYNLNFNKISYVTDKLEKNSSISFILLNNYDKVGNRDIVIHEDHYVVLANDDKEVDVDNIDKIGVLKNDEEIVKRYYGEKKSLVVYEKIADLINGISDKAVDYAILPNIGYMADIVGNKLSIVGHVSDLKRRYVLRVEDSTTFNVMSKVYNEYLGNNYKEDYSRNFLNIYYSKASVDDVLRKSLNSKVYKYGYVVNMPYENVVNDDFVGIISNYLDGFEKSTGVEINTLKFSTIDDLKSAIVNGNVDFVLANFPHDSLNADNILTGPFKVEEYVVVAKKDYSINSVKGFVNDKIAVVSGNNLFKMCKDNNLNTDNYDNTDDLLRNIDDNSIALIDKETYKYYKDDKLKDFKIIVEDTLGDYRFLLSKKNEPFNSIFNYYVSSIDYQNVQYLYNTDVSLVKDYTTLKVVVFIISLVSFLSATVYLFNRKTVLNNVISRDEKLKYLDPMTSLKNRSYLNLNIYRWDDNVIYPQSVVVLDINKIKDINDKFGREAGDEVIKKVASVLINNQVENTDIIRSGGDEFLIYMVGYQEKDVIEYTKKLMQEMENIPNSTGVSIGYSMILDDVKSVDDAINEAIIMMSKNKDKNSNG